MASFRSRNFQSFIAAWSFFILLNLAAVAELSDGPESSSSGDIEKSSYSESDNLNRGDNINGGGKINGRAKDEVQENSEEITVFKEAEVPNSGQGKESSEGERLRSRDTDAASPESGSVSEDTPSTLPKEGDDEPKTHIPQTKPIEENEDKGQEEEIPTNTDVTTTDIPKATEKSSEEEKTDSTIHHSDHIKDGVDLSVHDMPAFEEFRKEFYQNDTKINGQPSKVYEPESVQPKVTIPSSSSTSLRNYASHECGAKVTNSNKEALNCQQVINENKDEYVRQPCSARKWLVIELCEPVVVRKIEIANHELFSSTFENFTVYISRANKGGGKERSGKDWHSIGTFHAKDERGVQGFAISQLDRYTSFVKIEILSHYGKEHYCPITTIRVFGSGVDDDDDDGDDENEEERQAIDSATEGPTKVPTTDPPPTLLNETQAAANRSDVNFVFPPQPAECFLCYKTIGDVPLYCWPEHFSLLDDDPSTAQAEHTTNRSREGVVDSKSELPAELSRPCDPDSAPKVTLPNPDDIIKSVSANSDSKKSENGAHESMQSSPPVEMENLKAKVKATPTAQEAGASQILPTVTATVAPVQPTASDTHESGTKSEPEMPKSREVEHILPSPPTLAEPPTAAPETIRETPQSAADVLTKEDAIADEEGDMEDAESASDHPPVAPRCGKRSTTISRLSNQVKSLELNLQVTNRYLEEMSQKSRNQKEDLQRALNKTMRSLQNTTMKLEHLTKDYNQLKEKTYSLSEELAVLKEHVHQKETIDWLTPVISLGTLLLAVFISSCITRGGEGINRAEVERILEDLPDSPLRRHKRSGSDSGRYGAEIISIGNHEEKSESGMKKAKSYAAFSSVPVKDPDVRLSNGTAECNAPDEPRVSWTDKSSGRRSNGDHLVHQDVVSGEISHDLPIEIISPTKWRTFDTPDGKREKPKKKRRSGKTKSSRSLQQSHSVDVDTSADFGAQSIDRPQGHHADSTSKVKNAAALNCLRLSEPSTTSSVTSSFFNIFRRSSGV